MLGGVGGLWVLIRLLCYFRGCRMVPVQALEPRIFKTRFGPCSQNNIRLNSAKRTKLYLRAQETYLFGDVA